jgi:hypothetical protein
VEIEEAPGLAGFTVILANTSAPEGTLIPWTVESVQSALDQYLSGSGAVKGAPVSALDIGLLAGSASSVPEDLTSPGGLVPRRVVALRYLAPSSEALSPSAYAALCVYLLESFRESARTAGIPPAFLTPHALAGLAAVCEARCRGEAEDSQTVRALDRAGGREGLLGLWEEASFNLESALLALQVHAAGKDLR